jgi:hypothetical protein
MVFVIAKQSLAVHTTEIVETGVLVEPLLEVVGCEGRSLVFDLPDCPVLLVVGGQVLRSCDGIEQNSFILTSERNGDDVGPAEVDSEIALPGEMVVD